MSETTNSETYDIIFAGGGAAACITAGRLAQADPSLKILLIESGPHTQELQDHVQPGRYFRNLTLPGKTFTFHVAQPSDSLAGRSCLGGGSSVNFAVYTRAAASDYDDWETVFGNKGWGSKDLIPLIKKAETYQSEIFNSTHGTSGPIKASMAASEFNIAEQFLEVAVQYDKERTLAEDINDFTTTNKYGSLEEVRCSPSLHLQSAIGWESTHPDRKRVVRVIFEGNKAVGVEYVDDIIGDGTGRTLTSIVRASRLVVVSAGAFGSPAILERSGIGARSILEKNDIQVLVDLPGVGQNYMDHNLIFVPYFATEDSDTLDTLFRGSEEEVEPYVTQWKNEGKGLMAHNELEELGPEFEERWKSYFANAPDKPVMLFAPFSVYAGLNPNTPRGKYFSMCYFTGYPVASGHVHITSGVDAYGRLDFKAGYLEDMADVVVLRWAYKKGREIARRMNAYRGELDLGHPDEAVPKRADGPVDMNTTKIKYTPEDDKAIDEHHRKTVETSWHSMGTCAMKPREIGGVVDERLNVYGVQNLKVADCSISPGNVGANTYNTAIAIGEKSAVIIAEDLGIKGAMTSA
ncbi:hypothetical protein BDQ17DRAFT_1356870 [Cyathus striatus]|nr:hypothetical protein BDQ17DRAFT_1356870 [Cyathus striatus]